MKKFDKKVHFTSPEGIQILYDPSALKIGHTELVRFQNKENLANYQRIGLSIITPALAKLAAQLESKPQGISLFEWVEPLVFEAGYDAVFSPESYSPDLLTPFQAWAGSFPKLMAGMPPSFAPEAIAGLEKVSAHFVKAFSQGLGTTTGSTLIKDRVSSRRELGVSELDIAKGSLGLLVAATSNIITASFWFLFHVMTDSEVKVKILSELEENGVDLNDSRTWGKENLEPCVFLDACFSETLRITSGSLPLRICTQDTTLMVGGREVGLLEGDQVMLVGSMRYKEKNVRFNPDQWLGKDKRRLEESNLFFGFGMNKCTGRTLARFFAKTFALAMLAIPEFELVQRGELEMDWSKVGQGIYPPKDRDAVFIRLMKNRDSEE